MIAHPTHCLYLARHGQTDWNVQKRWQSRSDVPLNQTGLDQARAMAALLKSQKLGSVAILSSPLKRALDSARCMAMVLGVFETSIQVRSELREMDWGSFEGTHETELVQRLGHHAYTRWRNQRWHLGAPDGERPVHFQKRIHRVLTCLPSLLERSAVVVVAHQGTNACIATTLLKREIDRGQRHDELWCLQSPFDAPALKVLTAQGH